MVTVVYVMDVMWVRHLVSKVCWRGAGSRLLGLADWDKVGMVVPLPPLEVWWL